MNALSLKFVSVDMDKMEPLPRPSFAKVLRFPLPPDLAPIIISPDRNRLGWVAKWGPLSASAACHILKSWAAPGGTYDLGILDARKALCDAHPELWSANFEVRRA